MFEIDLFASPFSLSLLISFFAGILSFLSPCVLPIVPAYIAYMAGISLQDVKPNEENINKKVLYSSIAFVLGLSTVFVVLGVAVSFVGQLLLSYQSILEIIAGFIIILFGLSFIGVLSLGFGREFRFQVNRLKGGVIVSYILGLAFAFGWTPCIGPVLGSILALVLQEDTVLNGVILMSTYALGMGIPFILTGFFLGKAVVVQRKLKKHMGLMEKLMGSLLLLTGALIISGNFSSVSFFLLEYFPWIATIG